MASDHTVYSQEAVTERDDKSAQLTFFLFIQARSLTHAAVLSKFKGDLPSSIS